MAILTKEEKQSAEETAETVLNETFSGLELVVPVPLYWTRSLFRKDFLLT